MATTESKTTDASTPTIEDVQNLSYIEFLTQAGDSLLETINAQQEQSLKLAQSVVEALPQAPEFNVQVVETPGVELPSAREVVEVSFKFADKYLASQKAFAEKFLALAQA